MRHIHYGIRLDTVGMMTGDKALKFIDGKKFMAPEPERVNERPDYLLTHFDPKDEKGDELGFLSLIHI